MFHVHCTKCVWCRMCYDFIAHVLFWQLFFFYEYAHGHYALNGRVTFSGLAYLVFLFPVTRATGSCTHMFPFHLACFPYVYLYRYRLSTRLWLPFYPPFPLLCCRLVYLHFLITRVSSCALLIRLCLPILLMPSFCSLSTRLLSRYSWTLTHLWLISLLRTSVLVSRKLLYIRVGDVGLFPIFNLLCNHPKGVTCEIPRTLLVLSSSLAKATASRFLGSSPLFLHLPVVKSSLRSVLRCARNRMSFAEMWDFFKNLKD